MKFLKNRLRLWAFFLVFLMVFSCEDRLEDNTRILVKGAVQNQIGDPIEGVDVTAAQFFEGTSGGFVFPGSPSRDYTLGMGTSQPNGEFSFNSLTFKNSFIVLLKKEGHATYSASQLYDKLEDVSFTFDLGIVNLVKLSSVDVRFNNLSGSSENLNVIIEYQNNYCGEVFQFGNLVPDQSDCYSLTSFSRRFNASSINNNLFIETIQGSTIRVIYSLGSGMETMQDFMISQPDHVYEINY